MNLDIKKFSEIIKELIKFKSGTTQVPIRAQSWEELIWATLVFMFGDDNVDWDPQSHEKSVDVKVKINDDILRISAKAGQIKNGIISISSYRLTTFNNLKEKLKFIRIQHDNLDFYLICVREMKESNITYYVIKAKANKLAPEWLTDERNWISTRSGHELKDNLSFGARIVFKMSNQLWYSIPINYFSSNEILFKVSIPRSSLGSGLIEFLKRRFK